MDISCALAPVPDTPDHIALAERLGYRRAWVYIRQLKALLAGEIVEVDGALTQMLRTLRQKIGRSM